MTRKNLYSLIERDEKTVGAFRAESFDVVISFGHGWNGYDVASPGSPGLVHVDTWKDAVSEAAGLLDTPERLPDKGAVAVLCGVGTYYTVTRHPGRFTVTRGSAGGGKSGGKGPDPSALPPVDCGYTDDRDDVMTQFAEAVRFAWTRTQAEIDLELEK